MCQVENPPIAVSCLAGCNRGLAPAGCSRDYKPITRAGFEQRYLVGHPRGTASAMRAVGWVSRLVLACLLACTSTGEGARSPDASPRDASLPDASPRDASPREDDGTTPSLEPVDAGQTSVNGPKIELRLVFVHGVTQADSDRRVAHEQLIDLEEGVVERIAARANDRVIVSTARVNLYIDDSGELISPRMDDLEDGTGLSTAIAWRTQLIEKTNAAFPTGNIIFVGHSTGGRVVAEVGASEGMRDRVAGVVTVHGMIDALQSTKYNLVGPTSYVTACKAAKPDGWCEYSGFISAVSSLDWLARERHVLSLIGAGDCSPAFWGGASDQALPLQAQSSSWSPGITLTPAPNQTYAPAHGTFYGEFCHPDVVGGDAATHTAAVAAASDAIVTWLFDAAPRVVAEADPDQAYEVQPLATDVLSAPIDLAGPCPEGRRSTDQVDVAGLCRHPGTGDGDDHPFDSSNQIDLDVGAQCDATVSVAHHHADEQRAMRVWVKRYSLPEGGGLVSTLH